MPSRSTLAPGALPPRLSLFTPLPEGEVKRVLLFFVHIDAGACRHFLKIPAGELAVLRKRLHGIVHIAIYGVRQPLFYEYGNKAYHPFNVIGSPRGEDRGRDTEFLHILVVFKYIALGDLLDIASFPVRLVDDLVVHIGKVLYVRHLITAVAQIAGYHVENDRRTGVTDMAEIVSR